MSDLEDRPAPELPSGPITYLFTDIEGSTRLWQEHPHDMRAVLARHDALLTSGIERHEGVVVRSRGEGDSIFAVFVRATDALSAAHTVQHMLAREPWPEDMSIRVRMGLHTGESELRAHDYYGTTVNRCARLRGIAHGGQAVLSLATATLARDALPEGVSLRDLGVHYLKDLDEPEQVFQLLHPDLPSEFPPLNSLETSATVGVASTDGFVGRKTEMEELTGALNDAFTGRGRMVMLVGEPGIGKTRCAEELSNIAQARGAQVVWGQCHESEGAPPYWIWTQAIRSYAQGKDEAQLRSALGVGASDIASMIPEISQMLPDLQSSPELNNPEQARFRLFDSVTAFLKNASQPQPLVIVLDDLHWADRSSLMLLEFMVREMGPSRLLVIGTYRDVDISRDHHLSQALGVLTREKLFVRLNCTGLSQDEVEDYVNKSSGVSPIPGLAEAVHQRTDGNPLFVSEVVQLLEQEGVEDSENWATAIPEGVRDTIGRRLNRLSQDCNQALTTASVIGREFSLDLLDSLIDWADEDQLLDLLEQALSTHVIDEIPRTLGQYKFSHALIQETLSEEMSTTRRIRLHARIVEVLEGLYGSDAQAHADEIIYHLAQAERVLGSDKLLRYSMTAGELALSNYAYEEAEIHFQRVLDAKKDLPVDAETAGASFGLGRSQAATGETFQFQEAVSNLNCAIDFYIEQGDIERAVGVAEHPIHPIVGWQIGLVDLISRALELVPPDTQQSGHLLARYGLALALETLDYEGAQDAFNRALEIAQRESNPALEMQTLAFGADVDWYHFRFQDSLDKGLRAIELAERVDDLHSLVTARFYVARAWDFIGNLEQARVHATALLADAKELRDHSWLAWAYWISGTLARLEGDWETARSYNEQGLSVAPRDATLLCTRGVLEFENGDFEEGRAHSARLHEIMDEVEPGPNHEYACPALGAPVLARISGNLASLALGESSAASV
ncbi:MAG: AAA family ATPase, partial [SAR202 cluster bacterium]|nr:AAA family ATPase [SAR202 cluster bacterium]